MWPRMLILCNIFLIFSYSKSNNNRLNEVQVFLVFDSEYAFYSNVLAVGNVGFKHGTVCWARNIFLWIFMVIPLTDIRAVVLDETNR